MAAVVKPHLGGYDATVEAISQQSWETPRLDDTLRLMQREPQRLCHAQYIHKHH